MSNAPTVGIAPSADGDGFWTVGADGGVFSSGDVTFEGSAGGTHLNAPIVGIAENPAGLGDSPNADGNEGYWLAASDGGVFSYNSPFYGSQGGQHLNKPVVGIATAASDQGYYLVSSDGGVFAEGDAPFYGSAGGQHLNKPIVGIATTATGNGYYLVASDGGVFTYGDAQFFGSLGGTHLNAPIVGMAVTPTGNGYWLVAADGGVFAFGDAAFFGSLPGRTGNWHASDVVGMVPTTQPLTSLLQQFSTSGTGDHHHLTSLAGLTARVRVITGS